MARQEDKKNHIIIFKNKKKNRPDHPDMVGTMYDKDGVKHDIALWKATKNVVFYAGTIGNSEENKQKFRNKNNNQVESKHEDDDPFADLPL